MLLCNLLSMWVSVNHFINSRLQNYKLWQRVTMSLIIFLQICYHVSFENSEGIIKQCSSLLSPLHADAALVPTSTRSYIISKSCSGKDLKNLVTSDNFLIHIFFIFWDCNITPFSFLTLNSLMNPLSDYSNPWSLLF